jgi:SAM-dependent methyltransferase
VLPEQKQTIEVASASYYAAANRTGGPLYLETIGLSEVEKAAINRYWVEKAETGSIDPAISHLIGATCGLGYVNLIGRLKSYPIPDIPVKLGGGELLLDVGCNWGRWSISAARKGWNVVGIDPSLGAIMAARRAFRDERNVMFCCGDARFLPFKDHMFDCVFSYSVMQHFSEIDAAKALREIGRALRQNGRAKIQMAHRGGVRSTYIRMRSNYSDSGEFRVRYWSLCQIKKVFNKNIGPSSVIAEAFGGLGLLHDDWRIVSVKTKLLILISVCMKKAATVISLLVHFADSVYVVSVKS